MAGAKQDNIDSLLEFAEETSDEGAAKDARKLAKGLAGGEYSNLTTEMLQKKLLQVQLQIAKKQLAKLDAEEKLEASKCKGCGHQRDKHARGVHGGEWSRSGSSRSPLYRYGYCTIKPDGKTHCNCSILHPEYDE